MNWLAIDINDMPQTVQKPSYYTYFRAKTIEHFLKKHLTATSKTEQDAAAKGKNAKDANAQYDIKVSQQGFNAVLEQLKDITNVAEGGLKTNTDSTKNIESDWPLVSLTGQLESGNIAAIQEENNYINLPPVLTNITGEAVDLGIIYPAEYGSPNFITRGWYWCATVNTAKAGKYRYTMHITLFDLDVKDDQISWKPVQMTLDSHILISKDAMRNGFTGAGDSYLPIY